MGKKSWMGFANDVEQWELRERMLVDFHLAGERMFGINCLDTVIDKQRVPGGGWPLELSWTSALVSS